MPQQNSLTKKLSNDFKPDIPPPLCVVVNPPDDLLARAARCNVDIDQLIIRFTRPRKIIARLPVQLLDGLEIVTHHDLVMAEFNDAFDQFEAPGK